jgi:hypothetical protein
VASIFSAVVRYFTGLVAGANNQNAGWVGYLHEEIEE